MQNYIEKMGGNFLVAALIPSLAFVTTAMVIFGPIIPPDVIKRLKDTFYPLEQPGLLLLLFTVILGFSMSSLNTFIYKVFEGYYLLERFPHSRRREQEKARQLRRQLRRIEGKITRLKNQGKNERRLVALEEQRYYVSSVYQSTFPPSKQAILPTRFGNILRAAENYPAIRYGIDAVPMWSRLIHVIPDKYYERVDRSNNQVAFLINCSLLSLILSLLNLLASSYQFLTFRYVYVHQPLSPPLLYFIPVDLPLEVYQQRAVLYLVGSGFSLLWFWIFYKAALPVAEQYGNMIRSAFDLFRFELLNQLNLSLPADSDEETDTWRMVSEFVVLGDPEGTLQFEYETPDTEK
jgi:hypothetical protein